MHRDIKRSSSDSTNSTTFIFVLQWQQKELLGILGPFSPSRPETPRRRDPRSFCSGQNYDSCEIVSADKSRKSWGYRFVLIQQILPVHLPNRTVTTIWHMWAIDANLNPNPLQSAWSLKIMHRLIDYSWGFTCHCDHGLIQRRKYQRPRLCSSILGYKADLFLLHSGEKARKLNL